MDPVTAIGVAVGAAVLALLMVAGAKRSRDQVERRRPELLRMPLDPALVARLDQLLEQGTVILAIKELREAHPELGLAEAKEIIDAMRSGHRPPSPVAAVPEAPEASPARADLADRVRELLAGHRETEAIRLVCDETGMGILDAQKFVRALD